MNLPNRPKVWQEIISFPTSSHHLQHKASWVQGFMHSVPNSDPTSRVSKQKSLISHFHLVLMVDIMRSCWPVSP